MKRYSVSHVLILCFMLILAPLSGCHEPFDDTEIKNRLDDLEARVEKLEADFRTQMDALQVIASLQEAVGNLQEVVDDLKDSGRANTEDIAALAKALGTAESDIDAALENLKAGVATLEETLSGLGFTISAFRYHESTGKYEIVLSNGTILELMARDNAVDAVKVKAGSDGKLYWAIGGEFLKDADGSLIPISVTPAVRVSTADGEVEVSVNGGATWHQTGVFMGEEAPALFVSVTSDEKNAYFALADGTTLTVALSSDDKEMKIDIPVRKIHVMPGETRQVRIQMRNVHKFIIVKPEGWRASIQSDILSVTAPADGVGEQEGFIQIFAVSEDGKSAIHELKVRSGDPDVSISVKDGMADIAVSQRAVSDESWMGYIYGVGEIGTDCTIEDIYNLEADRFDPNTSQIMKESLSGIDIAEYAGSVRPGVEYAVWAIGIDMVMDEDGAWTGVLQAFEDMHYEIYMEESVPAGYDTPEGSQWTWRDSSLGCRRVFDFGVTEEGIIYIADFYDDTVKEGGKLPVDPETGEPNYNVDLVGRWVWSDYYENCSVTPVDGTSGVITFLSTITNVYGTNTTYFRVDYSNLTTESVDLYSPMTYLDDDGNPIPVLDADGNPVNDLAGYPQYWCGMGFGAEDTDGNPLPITLTLSEKKLEVVMLK